MTEAEKKLWYYYLGSYQPRFRRQEIIGSYIVDFYCEKAMLVIELDGSQHCEEETAAYDRRRTEYLESLGLYVLRIGNPDVLKNLPGVCTAIDQLVAARIKAVSP